MTDSMTTPPLEKSEHRPPASRRRWLTRTAAIGYSVAWVVGLLLTSSSTDVTADGSAIVREDTPLTAALTLQFLLTEGVAAVALLIVVIGFWRAAARGGLRSTALVAGLMAVAVSLTQTVIGVCLVEIAVRDRDAALASSLTFTLYELDGLKMVLLAVLVFAISAARWRRQVRLPIWLVPTGIVTGVALLASAIGYLARINAFSVAAWVSLPLLLIFITGVGLCVRPGSQLDEPVTSR
jgi:hypothetical protein